MRRPLRLQCTDDVFVVSNRTFQNEHLLDYRLHSRIAGALAHYLVIHSVTVYGYSFLPNGFWMVVRCPQGDLGDFMRDFQARVAFEVNDLHDREGSVFHDRYDDEVILDPQALADKLVEIGSAPVREGFCGYLGEYSGLTCWKQADALGGGERDPEACVGKWVDFRRLRSLQRSSPELEPEEVAEDCELAVTGAPIVDGGQVMAAKAAERHLRRRVQRRCRAIRKDRHEATPERLKELAEMAEAPAKWDEERDVLDPLGPPKYRWSRCCITNRQPLEEAYKRFRAQRSDAYHAVMVKWREEDNDFPTSTYPPGWKRAKGPLVRRTEASWPPPPSGPSGPEPDSPAPETG
jgi:hypothetical protein